MSQRSTRDAHAGVPEPSDGDVAGGSASHGTGHATQWTHDPEVMRGQVQVNRRHAQRCEQRGRHQSGCGHLHQTGVSIIPVDVHGGQPRNGEAGIGHVGGSMVIEVS